MEFDLLIAGDKKIKLVREGKYLTQWESKEDISNVLYLPLITSYLIMTDIKSPILYRLKLLDNDFTMTEIKKPDFLAVLHLDDIKLSTEKDTFYFYDRKENKYIFLEMDSKDNINIIKEVNMGEYERITVINRDNIFLYKLDEEIITIKSKDNIKTFQLEFLSDTTRIKKHLASLYGWISITGVPTFIIITSVNIADKFRNNEAGNAVFITNLDKLYKFNEVAIDTKFEIGWSPEKVRLYYRTLIEEEITTLIMDITDIDNIIDDGDYKVRGHRVDYTEEEIIEILFNNQYELTYYNIDNEELIPLDTTILEDMDVKNSYTSRDIEFLVISKDIYKKRKIIEKTSKMLSEYMNRYVNKEIEEYI